MPEPKRSKNHLSGMVLSLYVLATFHELASGKKATSIFRNDRAGHAADPERIADLACDGLVIRHGIFRISARRRTIPRSAADRDAADPEPAHGAK